MTQLVPIGRFSTMTRLSIKALRLYDRIGLLTPAEVDASSGYRYYSLGQANEAEAIRVLRGLDMSLDDIAVALRNEDSSASVAVLERRRAQLEASMAEHEKRIALVKRLISGERPILPYAVETLTVEPLIVLSLRRQASLDSAPSVIADGFGTLMAAVFAAGAQPAGMPLIIFHDVIDHETSGEIELCIPTATEIAVEHESLKSRTLAPAIMAATIHQGEYTDVAPAYHVLTGWMQSHGHTPTGPPREVYLDDPTQVEPGTQRTQVQWPIG